MQVLLVSVCWQFSLVYLDDTVVFLKPPKYYIEQVKRVLQLLCKAYIILKLKKWRLFAETIDYVGHFIRPGRIERAEYGTNALAKR